VQPNILDRNIHLVYLVQLHATLLVVGYAHQQH